MYVTLYLMAIVLANLSATIFGPYATVVNAFVFIGLDLTCRDRLHEQWHDSHLYRNMLRLIVGGSLLSFFVASLIGKGELSARIALASMIAFALAALTDTIVYGILWKKPKMVKINGSNLASAAVDSMVFPTVAFGSFLPIVTLGQFVAKVLGGFLWSLIIMRKEVNK
jgi:hypothetical protein